MSFNWEANTRMALRNVEIGIKAAQEGLDHIAQVCADARRLLVDGDFRGVEKCFEEINRYLNKDGEVF